MKTQGLIEKIRGNLDEAKRVALDLDREKVLHLWDQAAQAGAHEVVKAKKETEKRLRLARIELKRKAKGIGIEPEKITDMASTKISELRKQVNEVITTERERWSGKRRSS